MRVCGDLIALQRTFRAGDNGYVGSAEEGYEVRRVARDVIQCLISCYHCDSGDVELRAPNRQGESEGVIDARIAVNEDGMSYP
jgi:hypothetical protein